jgi:hypothetical protein
MHEKTIFLKSHLPSIADNCSGATASTITPRSLCR